MYTVHQRMFSVTDRRKMGGNKRQGHDADAAEAKFPDKASFHASQASCRAKTASQAPMVLLVVLHIWQLKPEAVQNPHRVGL